MTPTVGAAEAVADVDRRHVAPEASASSRITRSGLKSSGADDDPAARRAHGRVGACPASTGISLKPKS